MYASEHDRIEALRVYLNEGWQALSEEEQELLLNLAEAIQVDSAGVEDEQEFPDDEDLKMSMRLEESND